MNQAEKSPSSGERGPSNLRAAAAVPWRFAVQPWAVSALIFVVALVFALKVNIASGVQAEYFPRFQPALSFACGRPFANPVPPGYPYPSPRPTSGVKGLESIEAFLEHRTQSFSCADFPRDVTFAPAYNYQNMHRYSMLSFAIVWKVFGPSWRSVEIVTSLFFATFVTAAYGLARQFVPRWASLGVAAAVMTSGSNVQMMRWFRDYSKAPFMLAALVCIAFLVGRPRGPRTLVAIAATVGLLAGIGLGFRADLLAIPPLFAVIVVLLVTPDVWRWWYQRLIPVVVCIGVFVIVSLPVLRAYQKDHLAYATFQRTEGLAGYFNDNLGLKPSFADLGHTYSDYYFFVATNARHARSEGQADEWVPDGYLSDDYEARLSSWSNSFYWDTATSFPADFLMRAYRSIERTATLPISYTFHYTEGPLGARNELVNAFSRLIINPGSVVVLALIIALCRSRKLGILLAGIHLYFGLLNTVQFDIRHVFFLEVLFWVDVGVVAAGTVSLLTDLFRRRRASPEGSRRGWISGLHLNRSAVRTLVWTTAIALMIAVLTPVTLIVTRNQQTKNIHEFIAEALASSVPLQADLVADPDSGSVAAKLPPLPDHIARPGEAWFGGVRYFAAEFFGARCGVDEGRVDLLVIGLTQPFDRTFQVKVAHDVAAGASTWLFFPAYRGDLSEIQGLRFSERFAGCFVGFRLISESFGAGLTPYMLLNPDWEQSPAYLRL